MFFGSYECLLDEDCSFILPRAFHEVVTNYSDIPYELYMAIADSIRFYPSRRIKEYYEELQQWSVLQKKKADEAIRITAQPGKICYASDRKIGLPKELCIRYGIKENLELILIGCKDHFELWEKARWERWQKNNVVEVERILF